MPSSNKPPKRHIRPVERQPMKEWLIERLDSKELDGLIWVDRSNGIFKVKWCHGSRHSWNKNDMDVFERWAQHTGRHYHGTERDSKRWKPNFRCALNSLKTVKSLESSTKGSNAFRLFQILDFCKDKRYVKKEGNVREQRASKVTTRQRRTIREESSTDEEGDMEVGDTEICTAEVDHKELVKGTPEPEEIKTPVKWDIKLLAPVPEKTLPNFEKISPGLGADFEYGKRRIIKRHNCGYIVTQCFPARLEQETIEQYSQVAQNPVNNTDNNGYSCPDTPEDSIPSPTSLEQGNLDMEAGMVAQSIEIYTSTDESNDVSSSSENVMYQDHFPLTPPYETYPCQEQTMFEADYEEGTADHSRAIPKNIIISQ